MYRRGVWRLVSLETIDILGRAITDGREVYGEPFNAPQSHDWTIETRFFPEEKGIGMSGV